MVEGRGCVDGMDLPTIVNKLMNSSNETIVNELIPQFARKPRIVSLNCVNPTKLTGLPKKTPLQDRCTAAILQG